MRIFFEDYLGLLGFQGVFEGRFWRVLGGFFKVEWLWDLVHLGFWEGRLGNTMAPHLFFSLQYAVLGDLRGIIDSRFGGFGILGTRAYCFFLERGCSFGGCQVLSLASIFFAIGCFGYCGCLNGLWDWRVWD